MKNTSSQKILYFQNAIPTVSLAESFISLTPKVSVVGQDIYLDITSTEHLFGGESIVLKKAEEILSVFNSCSDYVVTEKAGWAKALCLKQRNIFSPGESQKLLLSLPVDALIDCGNPVQILKETKERQELVRFLRKVGIHFCSDFFNLPITSIVRQFGKLGKTLFHCLKGDFDDSLPLFTPEEIVSFSINTDTLCSLEAVLYELEPVFLAFEARLRGRGILAQSLKIQFHLENKSTSTQTIRFSHFTRSPEAIRIVVKEALSQITLSSPLSGITLEVAESSPETVVQLSLLDSTQDRIHDLSGFVQKMRNRLGEQKVGFAELLPHYLPEQSWTRVYPPVPEALSYPDHARPLFVFHQPHPFSPLPHWKLTELERLTLDWWNSGISRHYYLAENSEGAKLWVFWEPLSQKWFCHGSFN